MVLLGKMGEGYIVERAEEGVSCEQPVLIPVVCISVGEKRKCSTGKGGIGEWEIGLDFFRVGLGFGESKHQKMNLNLILDNRESLGVLHMWHDTCFIKRASTSSVRS